MAQISVIVPVYKTEQYLRTCVDSILHQSYSNLEVILVDDGSPDNCPQICDDYAQRDERVRVIHQNNAGVAAARNAGLDAACGEYITFVDSDDWIDPDMYAGMMEMAKAHDCDVVMCDCLKEYENRSQVYSHDIRAGFYDRVQLEQEYFPHLLMMPNVEYPPTISNWLCLFRNTERVPRYAEGIRYSEDLLFGAELMLNARSFYYMKGSCYYHYRMNPQSATHRFVPDKWQDYRRLHTKIAEVFGTREEGDFSHQIDLCLLFFVYNAVGELLGARQLLRQERIAKSKAILQEDEVRKMFDRLNTWSLPVSWKLRAMTDMYKHQLGLGLLIRYLDRRK